MERKIWLEDAIFEYVKNTEKPDSVDITSHFKLRVDITLESVHQLVEDGKLSRYCVYGNRYAYRIIKR